MWPLEKRGKRDPMNAARLAQLAIVLLGLHLLTVTAGGVLLIRRALASQERTLEQHLLGIARSFAEPPREYFSFLPYITDPETGLIDEDAAADYQRLLPWSDLAASLRGPAGDSRIVLAQVLTPAGQVLMTPDGELASEDVRDSHLGGDSSLLERARNGEVAATPLSRLNFVKLILYPIHDRSGAVVGILRLESNPASFAGIERTRNRILFASAISLGILVGLWLLTMRLVRRTIHAERAAAQADRLRALGTMTAGIAHEIRNPLNIITLQLEELEAVLGDVAHGPARSSIGTIAADLKQEAARLKALTEQFLAFSKASSSLGNEAMAVNAGKVAEGVFTLWKKGLDPGRRRAEFRDDAPGQRAFITEDRLRQVLLNLLRNADEALGSETGAITVTVRRAGEWLQVLVEDDGPGMSRDLQKEIFDPFFTTRAEGTGLGLSLSRNLVEAAGGTINVESEPGKGARFLVSLKLVDR